MPNKIEYPRKCNHCEYVANNPQMWHYHNKTHAPIPKGQLCDHGCGCFAIVRGTGGVYSCSSISQRCPAYVKIIPKELNLIGNALKPNKEKLELLKYC